jgi:hypothetical protein
MAPEAAGRSGRRMVFAGPPLLKPWQSGVALLAWVLLMTYLLGTEAEAQDGGVATAGVLLLGLAGIAFLPSWTEVVIDGEAGTVQERLMWFRWGTRKLSPKRDFEALVVRRRSETETVVAGAPGSTFANTRTRTVHDFELRLLRPHPFHDIQLPLPNGLDAVEIEALARAAAACGGWPAFRQGWRPSGPGESGTWQRLSLDERQPLGPEPG